MCLDSSNRTFYGCNSLIFTRNPWILLQALADIVFYASKGVSRHFTFLCQKKNFSNFYRNVALAFWLYPKCNFSSKFCFSKNPMYLCNPFWKVRFCKRAWGANLKVYFRGVAQLASASGLGPEGPVFESQYPDFKERLTKNIS